MRTFTVSREYWLRGRGVGGSTLRTEEGMSCCLGFVGDQVGVPVQNMICRAMPESLERKSYEKFPEGINWGPFAEINDDCTIGDEEREKRLQQLAEANGFRFKFVP
jgi:hypothetical protein